jgi:hypothetical protein
VSIRLALSCLRMPSVVVIGVLAAACGTTPTPGASAGGSPTGVGPTPSTAAIASPMASPVAATLLLRITSEGGFIGPAANLAAIPEVSVYADGRIMTPGPIDAVFPGPLLPPVQVKDVGEAGAAAIVAAIRGAGLDKPVPATGGGNPDTGTQVFVVNLDGATVTTRMGLGGGPGGPGGPGLGASPDPRAAAAADLLARLNDQAETWGSTVSISVLNPTAYRVYVAPGAPQGDGTTSEPSVAWPLATPLAVFGVPAVPDRGIAGLRQGAVLGADAATLGPVLAAATAITPFSSGGKMYTLYVRPLLPDEVPSPG